MSNRATPKQARLWDVHEAADFLNVSVSWLYKAAGRNEVPHCRMGHHIRFHPEELERFSRGELRQAEPTKLFTVGAGA